jgi:hypothetical protein
MTGSAREFLEAVKEELAPAEADNRLVPLIETGEAPREVFATMACEENRIVRSDWRSFLTLAARSPEPQARSFFSGLAQGEGIALGELGFLHDALGLDEEALREYRSLAGCQAYPSFVAWLALNAGPADAVVGMVANFTAWGNYCARVADAMRVHYGFVDQECRFFDFFATPLPDDDAVAAIQAGMDSGAFTGEGREYARLFQSYELMFWNTIADAL